MKGLFGGRDGTHTRAIQLKTLEWLSKKEKYIKSGDDYKLVTALAKRTGLIPPTLENTPENIQELITEIGNQFLLPKEETTANLLDKFATHYEKELTPFFFNEVTNAHSVFQKIHNKSKEKNEEQSASSNKENETAPEKEPGDILSKDKSNEKNNDQPEIVHEEIQTSSLEKQPPAPNPSNGKSIGIKSSQQEEETVTKTSLRQRVFNVLPSNFLMQDKTALAKTSLKVAIVGGTIILGYLAYQYDAVAIAKTLTDMLVKNVTEVLTTNNIMGGNTTQEIIETATEIVIENVEDFLTSSSITDANTAQEILGNISDVVVENAGNFIKTGAELTKNAVLSHPISKAPLSAHIVPLVIGGGVTIGSSIYKCAKIGLSYFRRQQPNDPKVSQKILNERSKIKKDLKKVKSGIKNLSNSVEKLNTTFNRRNQETSDINLPPDLQIFFSLKTSNPTWDGLLNALDELSNIRPSPNSINPEITSPAQHSAIDSICTHIKNLNSSLTARVEDLWSTHFGRREIIPPLRELITEQIPQNANQQPPLEENITNEQLIPPPIQQDENQETKEKILEDLDDAYADSNPDELKVEVQNNTLEPISDITPDPYLPIQEDLKNSTSPSENLLNAVEGLLTDSARENQETSDINLPPDLQIFASLKTSNPTWDGLLNALDKVSETRPHERFIYQQAAINRICKHITNLNRSLKDRVEALYKDHFCLTIIPPLRELITEQILQNANQQPPLEENITNEQLIPPRVQQDENQETKEKTLEDLDDAYADSNPDEQIEQNDTREYTDTPLQNANPQHYERSINDQQISSNIQPDSETTQNVLNEILHKLENVYSDPNNDQLPQFIDISHPLHEIYEELKRDINREWADLLRILEVLNNVCSDPNLPKILERQVQQNISLLILSIAQKCDSNEIFTEMMHLSDTEKIKKLIQIVNEKDKPANTNIAVDQNDIQESNPIPLQNANDQLPHAENITNNPQIPSNTHLDLETATNILILNEIQKDLYEGGQEYENFLRILERLKDVSSNIPNELTEKLRGISLIFCMRFADDKNNLSVRKKIQKLHSFDGKTIIQKLIQIVNEQGDQPANPDISLEQNSTQEQAVLEDVPDQSVENQQFIETRQIAEDQIKGELWEQITDLQDKINQFYSRPTFLVFMPNMSIDDRKIKIENLTKEYEHLKLDFAKRFVKSCSLRQHSHYEISKWSP